MRTTMEITSSKVSVYEVVLDLSHRGAALSHQVPGFNEGLAAALPTTRLHKCMSGEEGGFHAELVSGTNFAHVVEHVLLELIHLAHPEGPEFSGWTRETPDGTYVIHYGAPDFLTGRLAAILAVDLVKTLKDGQPVDLEATLAQLRDPLPWFTREKAGSEKGADLEIKDLAEAMAGTRPADLTAGQRANLSRAISGCRGCLLEVDRLWREAFFQYGGNFARGIADKVEILNLGHFAPSWTPRSFDSYFKGVVNLSRLICSLRIPINFVIHAQWQYKNFLLAAILDNLMEDETALIDATRDLDDFYRIVLHGITEGYATPELAVQEDGTAGLRGFRSRHVKHGEILVVDDDYMALHAARNILEYHGFTANLAADGVQALKTVIRNGDQVSLVLLDLNLPRISGVDACRRTRVLFPKMTIILSSGYPLDEGADRCLVDHEVTFLGKPFPAKGLIAHVRDMLDLQGVETG